MSSGLDQRVHGEASGGDEDVSADVLPRKRKRRRTPWYFTLLLIFGCLLLVVSVGTISLMYGLSNRYDSKVQKDNILGDVPHNENTNLSQGPLNYLVLGTDSRDKVDTESADANGDRSDTILLVHIPKGLGSAFIVAIPRDSYVDIPAGGSWKGGQNKINAAFSFGGANLMAKTMYNLTKVKLDGVIIVNFAGVINMVDAVGGVHVCVPYDVPNYFKGDFPQYNAGWKKGCHDMKGEEAEVFMRQRHDVPGGDFGRIRSQQLVMQALAAKASSSGVLTSPSKLDGLLSTAAESLTIDKSMNLRDLAFSLKGIRPDAINFATAPYKGTMSTPAGSSVELSMAGCQELFKAVNDDTTAQWLAAHPQPDIASYSGTGA